MQITNRNKEVIKAQQNKIKEIIPNENFYKKTEETTLATDIIESANLIKTQENNIIADLDAKQYNVEEAEKTLDNYENKLKGIQESQSSNPQAITD